MSDFNADLFVKLFSKLSLALGVTPEPNKELATLLDGDAPRRRGDLQLAAGQDNPQFLLAILNPGQYIPLDLNLGNIDDLYALSILFNPVPQFSWVYKPAASTVSNSYSSILDYKEAPLTSLTPEQKKKVADAEKVLADYKDDYDKYQGEYWVALDAFDAATATARNGGAPVPPSLGLKLQAAKRNWDGLGHRAKVDSATAVLAELEALEPSSFWYRLRERYDAGTKTASLGSNFQANGFSPPYQSWLGDKGWTQFTFDQKDMDNQQRSELISAGGGLDVSYGIFRVSGEGSYEEDSKFVKIKETELKFSAKLMRVAIDRGWMNPLVLSSRAWRWLEGSPVYGTVLSTGGDVFGDVNPTGEMTVIPTAAILCKDLKVEGRFEDTLVEEMNRIIQANGSVGIGPFSISGRFNMENHSGSAKGTIANNGIAAPDLQMIALICQVLPKLPDPDPSLPWPAA